MKKIADFCEICDKKFHGTYIKKNGEKMYLCGKHLHQMNRYGKIFKRTSRDKNEIIDKKNYCELYLYNKKQEVIAITLIDKQFKNKIKKYKWGVSLKGKKYYVKTDLQDNDKKKSLYLVNLILGKKDNYQIDHRDGNTLDNRKQNLRFCTQQQNLMNKSKAKGISWNKRQKKWEVYIGVNNKRIKLGYYINKKFALKIRRSAELKYYGEFAPDRE